MQTPDISADDQLRLWAEQHGLWKPPADDVVFAPTPASTSVFDWNVYQVGFFVAGMIQLVGWSGIALALTVVGLTWFKANLFAGAVTFWLLSSGMFAGLLLVGFATIIQSVLRIEKHLRGEHPKS